MAVGGSCSFRLGGRGCAWMRMVLLISLSLLLLSAETLGQGAGSGQKQVQATLSAPWGPSPLVMEAAEFWEGGSKDKFWEFVDALPSTASTGTDKEQYEIAKKVAGEISTENQVKLMILAMALRSSSPRVEMHRGLWQDAAKLGCTAPSTADAAAVAVVGSRCVTSVAELKEAVQKCSAASGDVEHIQLHAQDRLHPSSASLAPEVPVAVLYATVGSESFKAFHAELSKLASEGSVRYALRHSWHGWHSDKTAGDCSGKEEIRLQGYAVELAVKNMEYKAVDDTKVDAQGQALDDGEDAGEVGGFDFGVLIKRKPDMKDALLGFRDSLQTELSKGEEIKVWALKDLGIQASQHIMLSREPLRLMRDLSHNLPSLVSTISRLKVNASMQSEIEQNHQFMHPGMNLVLLNGRNLDAMDTTPFGLLETLKQEVAAMEGLMSVGMDVGSARKLLIGKQESRRMGMMEHDEPFRIDVNVGDNVVWLNDIEADARYSRWPRNLENILQRGWPGQLRMVRKNLYHAIYIVDPSKADTLQVLANIAESIKADLPIKFGILFYSPPAIEAEEARAAQGDNVKIDVKTMEEGEQLYRLISALHGRHGRAAAFDFIDSYAQRAMSTSQNADREEARKEAFRKAAKANKVTVKDEAGKMTKVKYHKCLNSTAGARGLVESTRFVEETGLLPTKQPHLIINGQLVEGWSEDDMLQTVQMMQQIMQRMAYFGEIDDRTNVYKKLVKDAKNVAKRYQKQVVAGPESSTDYLPADALSKHSSSLSWTVCKPSSGAGDEVRGVSHVVAADMASEAGRRLVVEAVSYLEKGGEGCKRSRMAFVDGSSEGDADSTSALVTVARAAKKLGAGADLTKVASLVAKYLKDGAWGKAAQDSFIAEYMPGDGDDAASMVGGRELAKAMGAKPGVGRVSVAGRVFEASAEKPFIRHDFSLAAGTEWSSRAKHVSQVIGKAEFPTVSADDVTVGFLSDAAHHGCVLVGTSQAKGGQGRQQIPQQWKGAMSGFTAGDEKSILHVTAFLDPLSKATQRMAPLLMTLSRSLGARVQVFLNPLASINEIPIKGYFRYVLADELQFGSDGAVVSSHKASFTNLPTNKLLTMNIHSPDAWFVEASKCAYDMDNILLDSLPEGESILSAHYALDHILVTGHASEDERGAPPAGLQLNLEPMGRPGQAVSDTTVMSNLGYFQLKARPGTWALQPTAGRSRDLYQIKGDVGGVGQEVMVTSFEPEPIVLDVRKRSGKEMERLSDDGGSAAPDSSIWGSFSGMFGSTGAGESAVAPAGGASNGTIHVFSLASGHLYERFLKIMMLSVVRNTKAPVKFWLLRNFLSPAFKESIGAFAKKHGFEYELVTYKWPSWLHGQTEKQRIIWGYKILMLDVLFPLSVNKIIYIDSDQVVRADLSELWNMDLKGRSLAYTPFCDSNKEMDGYRFWKQGFWEQHLGPHKYHISALYVVDLQRFRSQGHGDQLRVIYSQLSRDPNSLANLDQDLPNYAQHSVPIFSLPQEWLWCETWCSNDTKKAAKTIDLCNNPMTKEPKLDQAKRIVSEWVELDELRSKTDRDGADAVTSS